MKQINFVIIFTFCLTLALFAIENTETVTIHIVPNVEVKAPLAVELLVAIGLGGVLAWLFGVWSQLQTMFVSNSEVKQKNRQIKELEKQVTKYQAEVKSLKHILPPASDSLASEAQAIAQ
jgi:uncharacterized integral membrane protein